MDAGNRGLSGRNALPVFDATDSGTIFYQDSTSIRTVPCPGRSRTRKGITGHNQPVITNSLHGEL